MLFPYPSTYMYMMDAFRPKRRTPWDEMSGVGGGTDGTFGQRPWDTDIPDNVATGDGGGLRSRIGRGFNRPGMGAGLLALGTSLLEAAPRGDWSGGLARGAAGFGEALSAERERSRREEMEAQEAQRAQDNYDRQVRLTDAQIENFEADNERAQQAIEAKATAERAETEKQRKVVASLSDEQRQRLEPLIGTPYFYQRYWDEVQPDEPEKPYRAQVGHDLIEIGPDGKPQVLYTAPRDPDSGSGEGHIPTTRQFVDGTTRQWNPTTRSWDVLAKASPTEEQRHDDIATEADRRYRAWLDERMEGVGKPVPPDKAIELQKRGHEGIPIKVGPSERKLKVKMRDGSTRVMTEDQYMRWKFRVEAEEEVKRRYRAAQGMGRGTGDLEIAFDSEGNQLP